MCENMTARNKTQYTYKLICFESIFNLSGQNLNFNKFVSIKQKLKKKCYQTNPNYSIILLYLNKISQYLLQIIFKPFVILSFKRRIS